MPAFLLRFFLCSLLLGLAYWLLGQMSKDFGALRLPLTIMFVSPVLAHQLSPYLIGFFPALVRKMRHLALHSVQGKYYTFEENPIRFFIVDGKIWIPRSDLSFILTPAPDERDLRMLGAEYGRIAGQRLTGFSEAALMRILAARLSGRQPRRELVKFKHWLEADVLPNVKRLPESATQVSNTDETSAY